MVAKIEIRLARSVAASPSCRGCSQLKGSVWAEQKTNKPLGAGDWKAWAARNTSDSRLNAGNPKLVVWIGAGDWKAWANQPRRNTSSDSTPNSQGSRDFGWEVFSTLERQEPFFLLERQKGEIGCMGSLFSKGLAEGSWVMIVVYDLRTRLAGLAAWGFHQSREPAKSVSQSFPTPGDSCLRLARQIIDPLHTYCLNMDH